MAEETTDEQIIMYGTTWCPDCNRSKLVFEKLNINFQFINIEEDPAAVEKVMAINDGMRSVPTIIFPDGSHLTEPSNHDLESKLSSNYD